MDKLLGNLLPMGVPFLEPLAKGVVLLSAGALTTAFIFNWAYFLMLDSTLLGALVLSDHIETAIWCLPPILLFTAIVLGIGFIVSIVQSFYENLVAKAEAGSILAKVITGTLSVFLLVAMVGVFFKYSEFGGPVSLAVTAVGGITWFAKKRTRVLLALPLLYIVMTIAVAGIMVLELRDYLKVEQLARPDTVEFIDRTLVACKVVRIIDKGVIVATANPVVFMFVPKEQIRRVALMRPDLTRPSEM